MIPGPVYAGGSKYFNESTGKYEFANEQEYQDFISDPSKKFNSLPEGSYVIGSQEPTTTGTTGQQQQIISGQPQSAQEVNIMDYQGVQASSPVLQPQTQLAPQTQQIEIAPEELQQQVQLGTAPTATYTAPTTAQVAQPVVQPAVTAQVTEADLVEQPELTETSAVESIQQVTQEADAFQAAQLELGDVDPRTTVQGQLALLQDQFAEGETPIWAQGALRQANSLMAQRGLGSSSVAAEAITNALMQSAIPIAQQDASFYQTVTMQNLSNEQQTEMTKFNARLTSIFNDQAAENTARNINAASSNELAQFYANLSQNVVTTNASAYNAMEQFNSTAQNQMNQFAAELGLTADQINMDAVNEMAQFNAEQLSNVSQFNASMKNNREQFQVQNQVAIDSSNVTWRRDVNTANTSATNAALQMDVQNLLGLQQNALNNIWDHYDTILNFAFKEEQSSLDRAAQLAIATMSAEVQQQIAEDKESTGLISSIFGAGATLLSSESGSVIGDFFGL